MATPERLRSPQVYTRGFMRAVAVLLALGAVGASAQGRIAPAAPPNAPMLVWAKIPAGTFQMGCVPKDERCGTDEYPRHAVTLTRAFELMTTEVTVGMFRAYMKAIDEQPAWSTAPNHPVVIVTWEEADEFCRAAGGRLPTEAEWEHAARGGRADTVFPWGNQPPTSAASAPTGAAFESDAAKTVGSFAPNGYGLFDVAGNVWEWVSDWSSIYPEDGRTNPEGNESGRTRIVRGGSYGDDPSNLRLSNRTPNQPDRVNVNVGFRCARDVGP
jgi:formylglycine-generating enzyme required for sulfatase activity